MMTDLHTHLLPGIDDGAGTVVEALELIEALRKQNVSKAVCTPHFDPSTTAMNDFIKQRSRALTAVQNCRITLLCGSETVLHDYLFHYPDLSALCIENTRYILVELPYEKRWNTKNRDMLGTLINHYNVIPILAHAERYPSVFKHAGRIADLIEMGCAIQLNASALIDKKSRRKALNYIRKGYIDVLASDCHNMDNRPPVMEEPFRIICEKLGTGYRDKLISNAECIVSGRELREKTVYLI
jgi:protein-tyrosine phosphatase